MQPYQAISRINVRLRTTFKTLATIMIFLAAFSFPVIFITGT